MAVVQCANCLRKIGQLEQRYEYDAHIVCAKCAAALSSADESPINPEAGDTFDLQPEPTKPAPAERVYQASAAAAAASAAPRKPAQRKSAMGIYAIAIGISLSMTALTVYLYSSGTIGPGGNQKQREEAKAVEEYNRLLTRANQSMATNQNSDAIAALEAARALAAAHETLAKEGDDAALKSQIDALRRKMNPRPSAAPVTPRTPAETAQASPPAGAPDDGTFFANAKPPAPRSQNEPDIGTTPQEPVRDTSPKPLTPAPAAEPAPLPDVELTSDDVKGLLRTGWKKLAAKDTDAAGQFFTRVQKLKPASEEAAVGAAVILASSGKSNEAISRLESIAARSKGLSRPTLALLLRETNPVRSVLLIQNHLEQNGQTDEEAVNILGDSIMLAFNKGIKSATLEKAEAFYQTCEKKLTATRGSEARWGSSWMSRDAAERKWSDFHRRAGELNASDAELDDAESDLKRAQQKYADARSSVRRGNTGDFKEAVDKCQTRLNTARKRRTAAETAWKNAEKPVYEIELNVVDFAAHRAAVVQVE